MTTTPIIARWGWSGRRAAFALSLSLVGVLMFLTGNYWQSERPAGALAAVRTNPMMDEHRLAMRGRKLSATSAEALEARLQEEPGDLRARIQLLGYYTQERLQFADARHAYEKHALWIIEHAPAAQIAGTTFAQLDPLTTPDRYREARELWCRQVEKRSDDPSVLWNAASFFTVFENDLALKYAERGRVLEPNDPRWAERIGQVHSLSARGSPGRNEDARERAFQAYEEALALTEHPRKRWYMLSALAKSAFEAGETEKARGYATELLEAADRYPDDWNYGSAIHDGNIVLGRLALAKGSRAEAKRRLLRAGQETPRSPSFSSFGPNMALAEALLDRGERDTVLEYFVTVA